jgi:hypothetical protein
VTTFVPTLRILPPSQRRLWDEFRESLPASFVLYGGTALALRTGSRESEDFDFFTNDPVDAHTLASTVSWLRDAELVQAAPSTATFLVDRGGRVKISFVGALTLGRVGDVSEAVDTGVRRAAQAVRSVEMVEVLSATLA